MVFRCYILYFASLIMFMYGLFLDNDFRTRFPYFIISIAVVVVVSLVLLLLVLLSYYFIILFYYYHYYYYYYYYYYIFIKVVLLFCGYVRHFFVKILGSHTSFVLDICLPVSLTFNIRKFSIAFFMLCIAYYFLSYQ